MHTPQHNWFFSSPYISFGPGSLNFLESIPGKKCFIVTDSGIVKFGLLNILTDALKKYHKNWTVFDKVEPDPSEITILEGLSLCKKMNPDLIIALGGGSSIDAAKAIWALYERPDLTLNDIHPFTALNLGVKVKCIAIPTTSGTGAEATWAIVVTRNLPEGGQYKSEHANRAIIPNYAILDPIFTKTLPPRQTIATAFDALSHAFETLISKWHNNFADAMAIRSIRMIRESLPKLLDDMSNLELRASIHNAATMAGMALCNAQVVMGHAMGHALGASFHLIHGESVGVFIPALLQYAINDPNDSSSVAAKKMLAEVAMSTGVANWADSIDVAANKIIADVVLLQQKCNFPTTLAKLGINKDRLVTEKQQILDKIKESIGTALGARSPTLETYWDIIEYVYEGKTVDF
jgi:alcohol dehydrogenase class IV